MTPLMREAIRAVNFWFEEVFDLMRTAVLSTTVAMSLRPAAFMVSPDSIFQLSSQPFPSIFC